MKLFRAAVLGAAMVAAVAGVVHAQGVVPPKKARELARDRRELRSDVRDLRGDKIALQRAIANGNQRAITRARIELRADKRDLVRDRRALIRDRHKIK